LSFFCFSARLIRSPIFRNPLPSPEFAQHHRRKSPGIAVFLSFFPAIHFFSFQLFPLPPLGKGHHTARGGGNPSSLSMVFLLFKVPKRIFLVFLIDFLFPMPCVVFPWSATHCVNRDSHLSHISEAFPVSRLVVGPFFFDSPFLFSLISSTPF